MGTSCEDNKKDGTKTYFWYFQEGMFTTARVTYEFIFGHEGKIVSKRSYDKQPELGRKQLIMRKKHCWV
jgi:hypothetical protein